MSTPLAEIEERFIAACVKDDGQRLRENRNLSREAFTSPACRRAWQALLSAKTFEEGVLHPDVRAFFAHETVGADFVSDRDELHLQALRRLGLANVDEWVRTLPTAGRDRIRERMDTRVFSFATPPIEPVPRFLIAGKPICTPGNLANLIAQAKAGKTAFIAAMIAAAICADLGVTDRDTLGVTATAPGRRRLIHLDTEQSPFDHDQLIRRAICRAGTAAAPGWLTSFGLAGFSPEDLRTALRISLGEAQAKGGVHSVIIDGSADLVLDVNDAEECNAFVAELHSLAIQYDCPILSIVHENPGQDGGKMRGHLGSQLERKAESNLRLRKADGVTVLFSEKMRRAPILEKDGPRFQWNDDAGMHVSCESVGEVRETAKVAELRELADEVFSERLRYADALKAIQTARGIAPKTAEKRMGEMKRAGLIARDAFGFWSPQPSRKAAA